MKLLSNISAIDVVYTAFNHFSLLQVKMCNRNRKSCWYWLGWQTL